MTGDVFLSAAIIAYCGPFIAGYRKKSMEIRVEQCAELGIPSSPVY